MKDMWNNLERRARIGIGAGMVAILLAAAGLAAWAYRPNYQVLFADLAPRDAAAMTSELDKMKTPYRLGDGGNTILVPQEQVYKTRLKLMNKDVPLHGAVGFEVFNNADFGMTEFVQKVNYQRAVQGELTRTIQAIDDVLSARVHLAMPEQSLFKKAASGNKASVTLSMKPGRVLSAEQVAGIQRLVAASVPDIAIADVTVLDQHGVALTRSAAEPGVESAGTQLDSKRGIEDYLAKKINHILERTFGADQAAASVDVVLNMDQSKVTVEEVMPGRGAVQDGTPTGVMVRERISSHDGEAASAPPGSAAKPAPPTLNATREADYQVGRRVEQLAVASGTFKRVTVAVLVKQSLTATQIEQLKDVVSQAIGANPSRGDTVVVHSMKEFVNAVATEGAAEAAAAALPAAAGAAAAPREHPARQQDGARLAVLIGLLILAATALLLTLRRRARPPAGPALLDDGAREQMRLQINQWLAAPAQANSGVQK